MAFGGGKMMIVVFEGSVFIESQQETFVFN
jgi:hypothetical protein